VSSSGTDSYGGTVNGAADARLEKSGSGTLTLSGGLPGFKGTTAVLGGTLGLRTAGLSGAVTLTTPGTVSVAAPAVQGLMG